MVYLLIVKDQNDTDFINCVSASYSVSCVSAETAFYCAYLLLNAVFHKLCWKRIYCAKMHCCTLFIRCTAALPQLHTCTTSACLRQLHQHYAIIAETAAPALRHHRGDCCTTSAARILHVFHLHYDVSIHTYNTLAAPLLIGWSPWPHLHKKCTQLNRREKPVTLLTYILYCDGNLTNLMVPSSPIS
jgi:hypothetical protein